MSGNAHPLGYRSPDVWIDGVRWHLAVYGRRMVYRFHDGRAWRPITQWVGRKPKGLGEFFVPYRKHANLVVDSFGTPG